MSAFNNVRSKIAFDQFYLQIRWSLWYIAIVLVSYMVIHFIPEVQQRELNFISFIFQSTRIYMLVIGIIMGLYIFPYFVKNGVTRKDVFAGSALAATGIALGIMVIAAAVNWVFQLITPFIPYISTGTYLDFLGATSHWVIPVIALSLIILSYYIAGWIIAVGFYRYSGGGGVLFIAISIILVGLIDLLWGIGLAFPLVDNLDIPFPELTHTQSMIAAVVLVILALGFIRLVSRDMPIKLE